MASKKTLYRCPCHPKCTYTSSRKNNLTRHTLTMHSPISKPVVCCGIAWTTTWEARSHRLQAHNGSFRCDQCSRMFDRRGLLQRHMSVHTGAKAFSCPRCDYQSSHKSNMQRHANSRHNLRLFDGSQRRRPRAKQKRVDSSSSSASFCDSFITGDIFPESDDSETETSTCQSRSMAGNVFKTENSRPESSSMATDDDSETKVSVQICRSTTHNGYTAKAPLRQGRKMADDETETSTWQSRSMADDDDSETEAFERQSVCGNDMAWIFDNSEVKCEPDFDVKPREQPARLLPVLKMKPKLEADVETSSASQRHLLEKASVTGVDADDKREVAHILVAFQYYDFLNHTNKNESILMG